MRTLFLLSLTFLISTVYAQDENADNSSLDSGTIQEQYDFLWSSSNKYQNNKVVKMSKLNKFSRNVSDSLAALKSEIKSLKSTVSTNNSAQNESQFQIDSLNSELAEVKEQRDSFSFLGSNMGKTTFRTLFWIVTGILIILLILFYVRMSSKSSQASSHKTELLKLENEFEDFKKRSREKEQVLARQLQDELNKGL